MESGSAMGLTAFDTISEPLDRRVGVALGRIGTALRSHAWKGAEAQRLTPTQGDILALLRARGGPQRLSEVADGLGITRPTACDAVATLVRKGLLIKEKDATDGRAIGLRLTVDGVWEADRIAHWPDFLTEAVGTLSRTEQETVYQALIKMIGALQRSGNIAGSRMCLICRHFRPNAHEGSEARHHCDHFASPLGDRHLRLDCAEYEAADALRY